MNVRWTTKSRILSLFDFIGRDALYFVQKNITKRSRIKLPKIPRSWRFHKENIETFGAGRLIEFGAGKNLGQNLYISSSELQQTVVDLNPMLDFELVNQTIGLLRDNHKLSDFQFVASRDDLKQTYGIEYQAPVDMSSSEFDDKSFDICVSTNTLEHIPTPAIQGILNELRRVLQSGAIVSAQIDYSDHYAHTDRSISRLNFLQFSEDQWKSHNHKFFFQNRLRHGHYRQLFADAGFEILQDEPIKPCPEIPKKLQPDLLAGEDSDYCLVGRWVLRNP